MLSLCRAYVIAHTSAQNRSLVALAERAGFGFVGTVLGERRVAIEAERGEVVYFLVHHKLSDTTMSSIIRLLRSSEDDAIRYAPIVLVIGDCPFETILKYVKFGYDDIIALPEKRESIVARLQNQLGNEQLYVETDDYLGPDRRRMELAMVGDTRRHPDTPHVRLTILRTPEQGVRIIRRQIAGRHSRVAAVPGMPPPVTRTISALRPHA